jgi:hypothetical protein
MKTIVIVGGGYGGVALAKALEKQHHSDDSVRILLIEAKSHFYHTVGGLRAAVQDLDDVVFIPYANVFTSSRHQVVHATVNRFDKKAVYLDAVTQDGGDQIAYDFLVSSLLFFFFFFSLSLFSLHARSLPQGRITPHQQESNVPNWIKASSNYSRFDNRSSKLAMFSL